MGAVGYELLSARNFSVDLQGRLLNGSYDSDPRTTSPRSASVLASTGSTCCRSSRAPSETGAFSFSVTSSTVTRVALLALAVVACSSTEELENKVHKLEGASRR